jgi:bifunctional DNA-binding transcriptional regulator/antitoxin component of YhaV-PrlF toxin-antitoxin module
MSEKLLARISSDGQVALPEEIIRAWRLQPGDMIAFDAPEAELASIEPRRRRSVVELLDALKLPPRDRPLTQQDIEDAIGEAMTAKERRSRGT